MGAIEIMGVVLLIAATIGAICGFLLSDKGERRITMLKGVGVGTGGMFLMIMFAFLLAWAMNV